MSKSKTKRRGHTPVRGKPKRRMTTADYLDQFEKSPYKEPNVQERQVVVGESTLQSSWVDPK